MDTGIVAFIAIAAVVLVTPGQDTALTIRKTLTGGRSAGLATAVGGAGLRIATEPVLVER